jgi:hypothetical protein
VIQDLETCGELRCWRQTHDVHATRILPLQIFELPLRLRISQADDPAQRWLRATVAELRARL